MRQGPKALYHWRNIMKKWIALSLLLSTLGLTACNTMHGFGQDVERGGEKIQGTSDRNK
jgi:predicted small secreted protein